MTNKISFAIKGSDDGGGGADGAEAGPALRQDLQRGPQHDVRLHHPIPLPILPQRLHRHR